MKLILTYDVPAKTAREYFQFVTGRYVPVMQAMGLQFKDAWLTGYGDFPNRLVEFVARDAATVDSALANDNWATLNEQLQRYVNDFDYKVIPYREGFQF